MSPGISVIIAVYNRFELLKQVVESVLAQTLPASEIILVDDGSIDNTSELLPGYIQEQPAWRERVRYFHQKNQGQAMAANHGIEKARFEWVAFNANDDLWLPQKLEWQFRALEKFKDRSAACFTDAWFMNNPLTKMSLFQFTGKRHDESIGLIEDSIGYVLELDPVHGVHPVWVQTLVAKTDLVRRMSGFDTKLRYGEDDDFVFRLACETKLSFVSLPMVLIDRSPAPERHTGAAKNWHKTDYLLAMNQRRFEKRLQLSKGLAPRVREFASRNLSAVHSGWANWHLQNGDYAKAREAINMAVRYHKSPKLAFKWAMTRFTPGLAKKLMVRREENRNRRTQGVF